MLKSPITAITAVLAMSIAASAGPFQVLERIVQLAESRLDGAGAIYCAFPASLYTTVTETERVYVLVMTNEPTENVVMAASFGKDGSLVSSVRNFGLA